MGASYSGASSINKTITEEVALKRKVLFDEYVTPYLRMIYMLCIKYTCKSEDVQDNYTDVLTNLYKYIESYDPTRSIHTWLHIVTKRCVFDMDNKRNRQRRMWSRDDEIDTFACNGDICDSDSVNYKVMKLENYREFYNDDILEALDQLKPSYKRALLLQQAGYKLREIAEIEHKNGTLESCNIETVKSRLFLARQQLQHLLTRDGTRRTTETAD